MRLFTGIALPPETQAKLTRLIELLRSAAHLRWSPPYNLHITTKFIGEYPENRLDDLTAQLASVPRSGAFDIHVRGLGWFPNPHSPRVLWVGVHSGDALKELARVTDEATAKLGVEKETKRFSPHLTIARIKDAVPLAPLRSAIANLDADDFGTFQVDRFHLYRSTPGPSASIYTQLAEFPLIEQ
jgi:2'-5' RNA ligase